MSKCYNVPEPSLTPPEPETVCRCAYCGDEVYAGESVFRCDKGTIHADCVLQHIYETMSRSDIANLCGYREGIAGKRGTQ